MLASNTVENSATVPWKAMWSANATSSVETLVSKDVKSTLIALSPLALATSSDDNLVVNDVSAAHLAPSSARTLASDDTKSALVEEISLDNATDTAVADDVAAANTDASPLTLATSSVDNLDVNEVSAETLAIDSVSTSPSNLVSTLLIFVFNDTSAVERVEISVLSLVFNEPSTAIALDSSSSIAIAKLLSVVALKTSSAEILDVNEVSAA